MTPSLAKGISARSFPRSAEVEGERGGIINLVVTVELPARIYQSSGPEAQPAGLEGSVGNLSPTVNAVAALQVAAGLAHLLDDQQKYRTTGCFLDLLVPELESWS